MKTRIADFKTLKRVFVCVKKSQNKNVHIKTKNRLNIAVFVYHFTAFHFFRWPLVQLKCAYVKRTIICRATRKKPINFIHFDVFEEIPYFCWASIAFGSFNEIAFKSNCFFFIIIFVRTTTNRIAIDIFTFISNVRYGCYHISRLNEIRLG